MGRPLFSNKFKMTSIDSAAVSAAYEDVRADSSSTNFALFTYSDDGKMIECAKTGENYEDALATITDSTRCYIFARVETGDEMSKRAKFALLTFVGESVSPLKKAKVSTDKAVVKGICKNFAYECLATDVSEL